MKKKEFLSRLTALVLVLVLIPCLLLTVSAEDLFSGGQTPIAQSAADNSAAADFNQPGVFALELKNHEGESLALSACIVRDPDGHTYMVTSRAILEFMDEVESMTFYTDGYKGTCSLAGYDDMVAYLDSDTAGNFQALVMGTEKPSEDLYFVFRNLKNGVPVEPVKAPLDKLPLDQPDVYFLGAPIVDGADGKTVGFISAGDNGYMLVAAYLAPLSEEYSLDALHGGSGSGDEPRQEPGQEPGHKPEKEKGGISKQVWIIGGCVLGALVLAGIGFSKTKSEPESKPASNVTPGGQTPGAHVTPGGQTPGARVTPGGQTPGARVTPGGQTPGAGRVLQHEQKPQTSLKLRCVAGALKGQSFPLSSKMVIGRNPASDIRFPADTHGISGTHCEVLCSGRKVTVRDLSSTYGTFLGNVKMQPGVEYNLMEGESFVLANGGATFLLEGSGNAPQGRRILDKATGRVYPVSGEVTFGRSHSCTVRFPENCPVSGHHCRVYMRNGAVCLEDLGSTNGTYFGNGQKLQPHSPVEISTGVEFYLAKSDYRFILE